MSDSSLSVWGWLRSPSYILLLSRSLFDIAACGKHFAHRCSWPPRRPEPLAHRHFTSKLISGLVQMIKQYVSEVWALLTHEMRITVARHGMASLALPIRKSWSVNIQDVYMGFLLSSPPSLPLCLDMTASLLRAKVWGQFFCNQYTDRTSSSAHVCGNDHLWWAVTAVSVWCWALIGCICCQGVWGPFDLARLSRS